jgi:hypothetical protein
MSARLSDDATELLAYKRPGRPYEKTSLYPKPTLCLHCWNYRDGFAYSDVFGCISGFAMACGPHLKMRQSLFRCPFVGRFVERVGDWFEGYCMNKGARKLFTFRNGPKR